MSICILDFHVLLDDCLTLLTLVCLCQPIKAPWSCGSDRITEVNIKHSTGHVASGEHRSSCITNDVTAFIIIF